MSNEYEIDHKIETGKRWPALLHKLYAKPMDEKKALLLSATTYQSGEGLLNTVYMGSLAHASLRATLNMPSAMEGYKDPMQSMSYEQRMESVDSKMLNDGIRCAIHTIEYMLANPVTKCPTCGRIVEVK